MNKYIVGLTCRTSITIEAVRVQELNGNIYFMGDDGDHVAFVTSFDYWAKLPQPLNIKTEDK